MIIMMMIIMIMIIICMNKIFLQFRHRGKCSGVPYIIWDISPYLPAHILKAFETKPSCSSIIIINVTLLSKSSIIIVHFRYFGKLDYEFRWSNAV